MLDCINLLLKECEVKVVHWPINPEAPFEFEVANHIELIPKNEIQNLSEYLAKENPNAIFVTGWIDKEYSKALKSYKGATNKVIMFDTSWKGTLKQQAGLLYLNPFVSNTFDFAFVTGSKQKEYAQKLGISSNYIFTGLYSANVSQFQSYPELGRRALKINSSAVASAKVENQFIRRSFSEGGKPKTLPRRQAGKNQKPKSILYLGRYVKHKGIFELWQAFTELVEEGFESRSLSGWKLVCAGTGDQWENRVQHPNIEHKGFVQPKDFGPLIQQASFYVLPSHFEPWGVSVHEMAAAGLPMVISDQVGAKEVFLEESKNGFTFQGGDKEALKAALKQMMQKSPEQLTEMGNLSQQLAQKITPQKWVATVMEMVNS